LQGEGFWAFADAGRKPVTYRVEKMRLAKDKKSLQVNDSLTLDGIPPQTFDYRLGNR
jgi:predicted helicase